MSEDRTARPGQSENTNEDVVDDVEGHALGGGGAFNTNEDAAEDVEAHALGGALNTNESADADDGDS